jgi:polar amino acid transport system permease protein
MDFRTIEMFVAICVIYLALVLVLSVFANRLENRLNKPFRV